MCLLILEIAMLIFGLIGLISGKLTLSKNFVLQGTRARIAGAILALPLPLALLTGVILGVLISAGALPSNAVSFASIIEIGLVLISLAGSIGYASATKPAGLPTPPTQHPSEPPAIPPAQ